MTYIDCGTPFLPAPPPPCGGRVRRLIHRLAPLLAPALVVAALGCREDTESPTAPESGPALDITPAHVLSFRQVSAGGLHTCGVTLDNRAYCWGDNAVGQLGNGTNTGPETCFDRACSTRPVAVAGGLLFRRVDAGSFHTCGVTTSDEAFCWGSNYHGQIGDGTSFDSRLTPVRVADGRRYRQVDAGGFGHTCGVTPFDRAFCWGRNDFGQLGEGTNTGPETCAQSDRACSTRPVRVAGGLPFHQVSAAFLHTCAVTTSNVAYCWGNGGRLGDGTLNSHLTPVAVVGGRHFRQVSATLSHTCGLTPADRALCWGRNSEGQLGDNTRTDRLAPVYVHAHGLLFRQVSAGALHTCGVTLDNLAYCWGSNSEGEVGSGTTLLRHRLPTAVAGGLHFRQVSAGEHYTCGVTTDNRAYCWGWNRHGQIGDGTTTNRRRPGAVAPPAP